MEIVNGEERKSIFDAISEYNKKSDTEKWEGTVEDYIKLVQENHRLTQLSHARVLDMIESKGVEYTSEDTNKEFPIYNFFDNELFGLERPIRSVVNYLKSAASGSQVGRRILLLYGPTSSGKSQMATLLKHGLEQWSRTKEGAIYALKDSPMHENPLNAVPVDLRKTFRDEYGVYIDPLARLSPPMQHILDNDYDGNWLKLPVHRFFVSEDARKGIGTFVPGDTKNQSITELVGSVDFSKLAELGVESDPMAYKFDGELNVANRGIMEMIEMLKVDPKFLYVLLTLAQEKTIKTERFPLIYADEFILAHSVVGDSPVPYKKDGNICFDTIASLTDKNDTSIEVLAVNMDTKKPEWTAVKSFHKHPFSGNLIKTIQKNGVVETTWNHSIYSTDYECFYPEEKKDILVVRDIPKNKHIDSFSLLLDEDLVNIEGRAYHKLIEGYKGNGAYKKHWVKADFNVNTDQDLIHDLLTVFAWYITEGHVNDDHCIISQNSIEPLNFIKQAAENLAPNSMASIQDRSDKSDKTSRLHLSTKVWKKIVELNCGKYSDGKRIPDFVFGLPNNMKQHFLNEIIKGDGTKIPSNKDCVGKDYLEKYFRYKTTSKMLASQVCFLAAQLGHDFGISHAYTSTGKEAYEIRYRQYENSKQSYNNIEKTYVEDLDVYDIECIGNHSFVAGVGNVLCHNTNETEFRRFLGDSSMEALHDRIIVVKVPYNLRLSEEEKIYKKLISEADFSGVHIAPLTLKVASMFAILSRLEDSKDQGLTILKKMYLYNGDKVEGFTSEDVKNIENECEREGMTGVSPRYIFNCIADCISKGNKGYITPVDVLRSINDNFASSAKFKKEDIERFEEIIVTVVEEYSKMAKNEVQKAFFVNFDVEIDNLLNNYVDNANAFLDNESVVNEFGERNEPDERLMRSIEEKVRVTESAKESFRQEIVRRVSKDKEKFGKFDYKSHHRLKEALESQLFDERSGIIRLTVSSRNPDQDSVKRINSVIENLADNHGYTVESANQLLRYVSDLMAKS